MYNFCKGFMFVILCPFEIIFNLMNEVSFSLLNNFYEVQFLQVLSYVLLPFDASMNAYDL